jgi:hypothetical protein
MMDVWKKRFGLTIETVLDLQGNETPQFQKAVAEHQAGSPPSLDAMQAEDGNPMLLTDVGGTIKVDNWRELLAVINPLVGSGQIRPEDLSPPPLDGFAFRWATRDESLLYNTDLVKNESALPRTRREMADPKYKDKFGVIPFITNLQYGILLYEKNEWLRIVDGMGKNAANVLSNDPLFQRMLLGEFDFVANNTYYYYLARAKDPRAPVGQVFFNDYTPVRSLMYVVRKGTTAPAAATLFALWMTTPEAEAMWQPEAYFANFWLNATDLDKQIKQRVEQSQSKTLSFFDSPESVAVLKWYSTDEGRQYSDAIARAYTQRRQ